MADHNHTADLDARTLADLSALADGTLDDRRVPEVQALIAASPELTRRYESERRAVMALRTLRSDQAPARVRMGIANQRNTAHRPRTRLVYLGAVSSAVAAAVAALVLLLPGGAPGSPSVSQAAALALRGPVMAAPATHAGARLNQDVEEVYFPDWSRLGWRAVGQRIDRFANRLAVTVYYAWQSRQIAYTILATPPLRRPGTASRWLHGVELQSLASAGRVLVTWRRAGHTCILSASNVPASELAKLASRD